MGLDMYLRGEKSRYAPGAKRAKVDGFPVYENAQRLELGYWRKHPNLHGTIIARFAGGVDACQRIDLDEDQLKDLLDMVRNDALPKTAGFFFGESRESDKAPTIAVLEAAIAWLKDGGDGGESSREVFYKASW